MSKLIPIVLALVLGVATADAHRRARSPDGLGPMKQLNCHGPTYRDDFTDAELLGGAYSVDCYDHRGRFAGKMHHGPIDFTGVEPITVSFTHYDDDGQIDGYILTEARDTNRTNRTGFLCPTVPVDPTEPTVPGSGLQAIAAIEVPREQIVGQPIGWFGGTRQLVGRTSLHIAYGDLTTPPVSYVNFATYTFLRVPAAMSVFTVGPPAFPVCD